MIYKLGCLNTQAIFVVPLLSRERGFYSMYFLVPKNTGDFVPILELLCLNTHFASKPFSVLNIKQLLELVHLGNWFTTIASKEAYFQVDIALNYKCVEVALHCSTV